MTKRFEKLPPPVYSVKKESRSTLHVLLSDNNMDKT